VNTPDAPRKLGELRFRQLLVAVDGSPNAELALAAAITAAVRDNAAITLICVAPDVVADAARFPWPAPLVPSNQEEADQQAERILREAIELVPDDVPVTRVMKRGRAGQQIVAHATESNYDALLLGARGVGRVEAMLGSVSQYVMHHATIAVFVAHAPRENGATEPEPR
jgi:nucleotide-binding universal stress UspA family protein